MLAAASAANGAAGAQESATRSEPVPIALLELDVALSTVSAWLHGQARWSALPRALAGGVIGGSLMYTGQRIVGSGKPGRRMLGLQTVALGANVARNIGRGEPALSDLTLPFFPLYVRIRHGMQPAVSIRLSVFSLLSANSMYRRHGTLPDIGRSLSTGALVYPLPLEEMHCYRTVAGECTVGRIGEHMLGAVGYAIDPVPCTVNALMAHEAGHLAQDVRDVVLNAVPASDLVLGRVGAVGRWLSRYVVVDVFLPFSALSHLTGPPVPGDRCGDATTYYECEAEAMTRVFCGAPDGS
jgi:hypothetical protein